MYYEINIAKGGRHYFATAERSITTREQCAEIYGDLVRAFPPERGFQITVSHRMNSSTCVTNEIVDAFEQAQLDKIEYLKIAK